MREKLGKKEKGGEDGGVGRKEGPRRTKPGFETQSCALG
jgi:hypothetical protein